MKCGGGGGLWKFLAGGWQKSRGSQRPACLEPALTASYTFGLFLPFLKFTGFCNC